MANSLFLILYIIILQKLDMTYMTATSELEHSSNQISNCSLIIVNKGKCTTHTKKSISTELCEVPNILLCKFLEGRSCHIHRYNPALLTSFQLYFLPS